MFSASLAQWSDLATFLIVRELHGTAGESNPVARFLFEEAGPLGLVALKCIALLAIALYHGRFRHAVLTFCILAGLLGSAVNTLAALL